MKSKQEYLDACKQEAEYIRLNYHPLLQYLRDEKNNRVGVLLGMKDHVGRVLVGWSKCRVPKDKFNPDVAIVKAFNRRGMYDAISKYGLLEMNKGRPVEDMIDDELRLFCRRLKRFYHMEKV